ncbi:MAG TPA: hypothetical protein VF845_09435 [Terriglobales bacterium]
MEQSRLAVDELIDVAGRATIEAVLQLSAEQIAGPQTPGQRRAGLLWHGRQSGRVCWKERKLGVSKPRLREKGGGEVAIPAYTAMQELRKYPFGPQGLRADFRLGSSGSSSFVDFPTRRS